MGLVEFGHHDEIRPCKCVGRAIFRACLRRYHLCQEQAPSLCRSTYDWRATGPRRAIYGRKAEEYSADVVTVSKRHLSPAEFRLFRSFHLWRVPAEVCARRLGLSKGNFWHAVYRIEARLGVIYRELQPYALFPVAEYFAGSRGEAPAPPLDTPLRLGMTRAFAEHSS